MASTTDKRAAIIDKFGELSRQVEEFAPIRAEYDAMRKVIQGWFDGSPADEPAILQGRLYTLQASPRENLTKLKNIRHVFRAMGESKFLDHCNITLKAVKDVLGAAPFESLVTTDRNGQRTLKTVARASLRSVA